MLVFRTKLPGRNAGVRQEASCRPIAPCLPWRVLVFFGGVFMRKELTSHYNCHTWTITVTLNTAQDRGARPPRSAADRGAGNWTGCLTELTSWWIPVSRVYTLQTVTCLAGGIRSPCWDRVPTLCGTCWSLTVCFIGPILLLVKQASVPFLNINMCICGSSEKS